MPIQNSIFNIFPTHLYVVWFVFLAVLAIDAITIMLAHAYIISNKKFKYFKGKKPYLFFTFGLLAGEYSYDKKLERFTLIHRILFPLSILLFILFIVFYFSSIPSMFK